MTATANLPLIDMAGVREGDQAALLRAGEAIRKVCSETGFFYIINHGVPQSVIDAAMAAARTFFAHPAEVKRQVAVNKRHRGWHALGGALMYEATKPDFKEFFSMGLELPEDDPCVLAGEALRAEPVAGLHARAARGAGCVLRADRSGGGGSLASSGGRTGHRA